MTSLRQFKPNDLFIFNKVNLDPLTETYEVSYYMEYLMRWPNLCSVAESFNKEIAGYIIGKAEGNNGDFHTHVSALSVECYSRNLGVATQLMDAFEDVSVQLRANYADLFVRASNKNAINLYEKRGYVIHRTIQGGYPGKEQDEDAFEMRKYLPVNPDKPSTIVPIGVPNKNYG